MLFPKNFPVGLGLVRLAKVSLPGVKELLQRCSCTYSQGQCTSRSVQGQSLEASDLSSVQKAVL